MLRPQDITLAPLDPADGPTLRAMRLAALTDAPTAFGSTLARESAWTDADWADRARERTDGTRSVTFIAWHGSHPVGISGGYVDPADPTLAHLVSMWVAPDARRTGISRRLVDAVLAWARSRGLRAVTLSVTVGNTAAERLYTRAGFTPTAHRYPHRGFPDLQMQDLILQLTP